ERRTAHAGAAAARIGGRAGVAVAARGSVVCIHTPRSRVAAVIGTHVAIVAIGRWAADAATAAAGIVGRARVAILARVAVVRVGAARPRIAAVVGANVVVVAVGGWA